MLLKVKCWLGLMWVMGEVDGVEVLFGIGMIGVVCMGVVWCVG